MTLDKIKKEVSSFPQKRLWKILACVGFAITAAALFINIFVVHNHIHGDPGTVPYAGFAGNIISFTCFFLLIFFPQNFKIYGIMFYLYGISNFLNNGNMLALFCTITSYAFMYCAGMLKKKNFVFILVLVLIPFICFLSQIASGKEQFLVSLALYTATLFIFSLLYFLLFPYIRKYFSQKQTEFLSAPDFSKEDVENLKKVQTGVKYEAIAIDKNVSGSSVKAMMVRLYRKLGVSTREEFLVAFNNTEFVFK